MLQRAVEGGWVLGIDGQPKNARFRSVLQCVTLAAQA
jgi:hypothetical protein